MFTHTIVGSSKYFINSRTIPQSTTIVPLSGLAFKFAFLRSGLIVFLHASSMTLWKQLNLNLSGRVKYLPLISNVIYVYLPVSSAPFSEVISSFLCNMEFTFLMELRKTISLVSTSTYMYLIPILCLWFHSLKRSMGNCFVCLLNFLCEYFIITY